MPLNNRPLANEAAYSSPTRWVPATPVPLLPQLGEGDYGFFGLTASE